MTTKFEIEKNDGYEYGLERGYFDPDTGQVEWETWYDDSTLKHTQENFTDNSLSSPDWYWRIVKTTRVIEIVESYIPPNPEHKPW